MKLRIIAAVLLALALSAGAAAAQPATSLKDQIVGSWNFVVAEVTAPDGKKSSVRRDAQGHPDLHGRRPLRPDPCRRRRAQDRVQQPFDRHA
jgi:opacity protein-like surface antigen